MAARIYCIDNDILKKLATFQLFDSTLEIFNATYNDVRILETAKYKFARSYKKFKAGRSRKSSDNVIRWEELIYLTKKLPYVQESDSSLLAQLSKFEDIDAGEAVLVSFAVHLLKKETSAQILTGDKRFIKALAKVDSFSIQQCLANRIICLEQIIVENINYLIFETVRTKVVPVRECDTAIKVVFGSGFDTSEVNARSALDSYIADLRNESNGLLWLQ